MKHLLFIFLLCIPTAFIHAEEDADPAEVLLGERLFLETRFAQFFSTHMDVSGNVNIPLTKGDPILDKTVRFFGLPPYQIPFIDGPYAGQSINCRTCHLVDEHLGEEGQEQSELGMRSYADFASRSPLPTREDGQTTTVRNSPVLVDVARPRKNYILHSDGEFSSLPELVRGTLTDRNMGWLPGEKELAIEHICKVMREDDGSSPLAKEFGGLSYTQAFKGSRTNNNEVEIAYLLPQELRIDVQKSSCEAVFNSVANTIAIYISSLLFAENRSIISPYDLFLEINHLPTHANENESNLEYSKRLMQNIQSFHKESKLQFVEKNPNTEDGEFEFHDTPYVFGKQELAGMQVFFNQTQNNETSLGNCIACHPAPHFTDHSLHNTGITQVEYDALHGQNAFNKLKIPTLTQRDKNADLYLPATHRHSNRKGIFRSIPSESDAMKTDLGAWNIMFNSDYPLSQESLYNLICMQKGKVVCTSRNNALEKSVARFKTPTLRNLGHSAPYMHNGQISDLHAVTSFYLVTSINTRQDQFRNPDVDIAKIDIKAKDLNPLVLFLRSLYEDYN